jgi:hypothetical protein
MADIRFTAHTYYRAALDHLGRATRLVACREYFASHYFAGIAVESVLRALAMRRGEPFSSNHSILFWAGKAGMIHDASRIGSDMVPANLNEIEARWRASHRYLPEQALATYLHDAGLDRRIRGNRIKYSATRLLELAAAIVAIGEARWK